ncbi:MAG: thiamine pyrophosphate-dependent enzyme, partial [Planctomycetota bacterium]
ALSSVAQVRNTKKAIKYAFELQLSGAQGLSLVEVLSPCPTYWRLSPAKAMEWIESHMTKVFPLGQLKGKR